MPDDELFGDLPEQLAERSFDPGRHGCVNRVRDQVELRAVDLDRLIASDHRRE